MENIFSHITTVDFVGLVIAMLLMLGVSTYVSRFRKNPIDLIGKRNIFFTFSGIALLVCLLAVGVKLGSGGMNLSLEFTGGTMMEVGFADKSVTSEQISEEIRKFSDKLSASGKPGLKDPVIQMITNTKQVTYPEQMRKVSITVSRKDATAVDTASLNGLTLAFEVAFGKVLLEKTDSEQQGAEALVEFLVEDKEGMFVVSSPIYNSDEEKGDAQKTYTFADDSFVSKIVEDYDPNLNVVSVAVGDLTAPSTKSQEFKSAIIRVTKDGGNNLSTAESSELVTDISNRFQNIYLFKSESIGPSVGEELARKAFWAIIVSLILQFGYIAVRFNGQARYGLAADISLLHDLIIMFGVYAIVGREIDSPFVAAILTVIGYSVMDSIIIFDRIRENLQLFRKESYSHVVNLSINQTMTRSINTLITVLITLFALYFFGGETLKNFAFALIVGCSVGAYSSIFLAAPIVVMIDERVKKEKQELLDKRRDEMESVAKEKAAAKESKEKKKVTSLRTAKRKAAKKQSSDEE